MPELSYTIVRTAPVDEQTQLLTEPGAINGGMMKRTADTPAPVLTVGVDSINEALKKIEARVGTRSGRARRSPG